MKQMLIVLSLLVVMALVPAPVQAQGEVPPSLAYIDAQVDVMLPYLTSFQSDYYQTYSRYFQALQSHSTIPSVPTAPDNLSGRPEDQEQDLAYFWSVANLPDEIAWSFRIDTYSGSEGDGYVLICVTKVDGVNWYRSINFGPEEWRAFGWLKESDLP